MAVDFFLEKYWNNEPFNESDPDVHIDEIIVLAESVHVPADHLNTVPALAGVRLHRQSPGVTLQ